jgi:hypothetical protein
MNDQIQHFHQIDRFSGGIDTMGKPIHLPDGGKPPLNFLDDAVGAALEHIGVDGFSSWAMSDNRPAGLPFQK